jgi:Tfp pilus assembly protein PilF
LNKAKREFIDIAFRRDSQYAPTHRFLGLYFTGMKNKIQAEQAFRKAISINPEHTLAHNNLGILLSKGPERQEEAIEHRRIADETSSPREV